MEISNSPIILPADQAPKRPASESATQKPAQAVSIPAQVLKPGDAVRAPQSAEDFDQARRFTRDVGSENDKGSAAVQAYSSLAREAKKDEIHQLFGVDVYA